ncbi:MAG: hypothetical protein AAFR51_18110 [Pseudomonadota bacterium]
MSVRQHLKATFVIGAMFGLSACGGPVVDPSLFNGEIQQLADEENIYGRMYASLKEHRPSLFVDYHNITLEAYLEGYSAQDSTYIAGLQLQSSLRNELLKLAKVASDDDVREMIKVTVAGFEHLNEEDPDDCARSIDGVPLENVKSFPRELRQQELELLLELLNAPQSVANRRAASQKEVGNWVGNVATLEPKVALMLSHQANDERTGAQNKEYCEGTIELYKRLSYKKGASRGTLYRGLALMSLQQRLHHRNTTPEDAA